MTDAEVQHGLLPRGTETAHGTIERSSLTAYVIGDQSVWFTTIRGACRPASPLVVLQ